MTENQLFQIILISSFLVAIGTFITLFFIAAPYGRHTRQGWGPQLPNWLGWLMMEAPSPLMMAFLFLLGKGWQSAISITFLLMWQAHYVHRAFIYPFQLRNGSKRMPLVVALLAVVFNLGNGYTNGRHLFFFAAGSYPLSWFTDPRFILGAILFLLGFIINRWADAILRMLRQPGTHGYQIPQGGLYRFISCPNYLGEIIEWIGWGIATWSIAGLAFAVWTIANLAPRARSHHRWYHSQFAQFPRTAKRCYLGFGNLLLRFYVGWVEDVSNSFVTMKFIPSETQQQLSCWVSGVRFASGKGMESLPLPNLQRYGCADGSWRALPTNYARDPLLRFCVGWVEDVSNSFVTMEFIPSETQQQLSCWVSGVRFASGIYMTIITST